MTSDFILLLYSKNVTRLRRVWIWGDLTDQQTIFFFLFWFCPESETILVYLLSSAIYFFFFISEHTPISFPLYLQTAPITLTHSLYTVHLHYKIIDTGGQYGVVRCIPPAMFQKAIQSPQCGRVLELSSW